MLTKLFVLPQPGVMAHLSPPTNPLILKGIKIDQQNPFHFDFILDKGDFVGNNPDLSLQEGLQILIVHPDAAMRADNVGGIDLNLSKIQIQESGDEITISGFEELKNMPIDGFVPVIVNLTHIKDINVLLEV